jgi:hypothetical protein
MQSERATVRRYGGVASLQATNNQIEKLSFPLVAAVLRSACLTKITRVVSSDRHDAKTSKEKGI